MLAGVSGRPDVVRFGRIVRARREQLGYQQETMPHGPSSTTMSDIENGDIQTLAAKTFRKLDESLEWEAGSARLAYEGGDPKPLENRVVLELQSVPTDDLLDEIRRRIDANLHSTNGAKAGPFMWRDRQRARKDRPAKSN